MLSDALQALLNRQIKVEFDAAHYYLSMSAWCEDKSFSGFAKWLRLQSSEEYSHGMRLYDYVLTNDGTVKLEAVESPKQQWDSYLDVFKDALRQEQETTKCIHEVYAAAQAESAFGLMAQLQWFLTEQVEEENTARDIVAKMELIGSDPAGLLHFDRDLGSRAGADPVAEAIADGGV